jgi:hypothetical protein
MLLRNRDQFEADAQKREAALYARAAAAIEAVSLAQGRGPGSDGPHGGLHPQAAD